MATVIDALIVTLGMDSKGFDSKTKDVDKVLKKTGDSTRKLSKDADAMGKQYGRALSSIRNQAIALFAVFTAGKGIKNFITDTVSSTATLGKLSDNIGISVNRLRAYQLANEKAGGSQGGLVNQLKESANAIAEMKNGFLNEGVANAFRMGLRQEDLKDAETYLKARADIVAKLYQQDPAQAQLWAQKMGLSDDVFEAIKGGSGALEEYVRQAQKVVSVNEADAKASEKLRRQMVDLKRSLTEIAERVSFSLIPILGKFGDLFQKLSDSIGENKGVIGDWANDAAKAIDEFSEAWKRGEFDEDIQTLKDIASAFMDVVKAIVQLVKWGWELVKVWNAGRKAMSGWGQDDYDEGANGLFMDTKPRGPDQYKADPRGTRKSSGAAMPKTAPSASQTGQSKELFSSLEQQYGLPEGLLDAVWYQESRRGKNMLSPAGAKGHFQFMDPTAKQYGLKDPYNLSESANAAARMYRDLLKKYNGDVSKALAAYNWGQGNVDKKGLGVAPKETRDYITQITHNMGRGNASKAVALANASASSSTNSGLLDRNRSINSETNIGDINVYTNAKDGKGIGRDIETVLKRGNLASRTNTGLS